MKTASRILIFLVLLALPAGLRAAWFYRGVYNAPEIAVLDPESIQLPGSLYQAYEDPAPEGDGRVVFDISHANNLAKDDLTPLRERLTKRKVETSVYDGNSDAMETQLLRASAWVVVAPTTVYESWEVNALKAFVEDGGRLLLAADPTRYAEFDPLGGMPAVSAYPAINSLANGFGIQFYDDYLYDQAENAGNYRMVRYSEFATNNPLAAGLETLVLPAASSIQAQSTALVLGGESTHSNLRSVVTGLSPAVLAGEGRILAVGDVTFFTPPFNTMADNDHFLSNIADWLGEDGRERDFADFPLMFNGPVSLSAMLDDPLDPYLLASSQPLFDLFDQEGLDLVLTSTVDLKGEAVLVGTYGKLEAVADALEKAGVQVDVQDRDGEPVEGEDPAAATVSVQGLGTLLAEGTGLFVTSRGEDGMRLIVLASDQDGLLEMMSRLVYFDYGGCRTSGDVTACAVGEASSGFSPQPSDEGGQGSGAGGRVFILSFDDRQEGMQTSSTEIALALADSYEVTVWYTSEDGIPADTDLGGYDAYIIDSGDYAFSEADYAGFQVVSAIDGNVMITGEQPLPPDIFPDEPLPLADLEVLDGRHPIAAGFEAGQVIALLESASGVPAMLVSTDSLSSGGSPSDVVFIRGPESGLPGAPVVLASEQEGNRYVLAFLAIYRLPEDVQALFVVNVVEWLTGGL